MRTGFVRISSNPAFTPNPPSPLEALTLLKRIMALPGHDFWPANLSAGEAFSGTVLATHRQVSDACLLALAAAHDSVLATLDRSLRTRARRTPERLEIILEGGAAA